VHTRPLNHVKSLKTNNSVDMLYILQDVSSDHLRVSQRTLWRGEMRLWIKKSTRTALFELIQFGFG